MSKPDEKQTKHHMIVRLLSETPITYASALFHLAKSIDKDILEENDLLLVGFDFDTYEPGTHKKKEKGSSRLSELAARSPGVIGAFFALLKDRSPRDLYVGFCGTVLLGILLYKWILRAITGTF